MPLLLMSQKNALFDRIENVGLSPNNFDFLDNLGNSTRLNHKNSQFFFIIQQSDGYYHLRYSPGEFTQEVMTYQHPWLTTLEFFQNWLSFLKREITAEDKWGRLKDELNQVNITYPEDSDRFTAAEFEALKLKMIAFKIEIRQLSFSDEQLKVLERKIDHLTEIAVDLSKFDWKGLFVGTIVSIIVQLSVTPDNAKALWDIIRKVFSNYFLLN